MNSWGGGAISRIENIETKLSEAIYTPSTKTISDTITLVAESTVYSDYITIPAGFNMIAINGYCNWQNSGGEEFYQIGVDGIDFPELVIKQRGTDTQNTQGNGVSTCSYLSSDTKIRLRFYASNLKSGVTQNTVLTYQVSYFNLSNNTTK